MPESGNGSSSQPSAGVLRRLRRYPVKGMAGEDLSEAYVSFAGILGDRVYAFTSPDAPADFPWMTARIWRGMLLLKPRFLDAPPAQERVDPSRYRAEVLTPEGERFGVDEPRFLEYLQKKFGRELTFHFSERSMQDTRPVSIFGVKTIESLSKETGMELDVRRFRSNLLVDWLDERPFFEETLLNRRVRIGNSLELMMVKKDQRCVVITLNPDTGEPSPQVFEAVTKNHGSCAGMYAAVLREGVIRPGDAVFVD
jgi:uncharacterized protein YcbX